MMTQSHPALSWSALLGDRETIDRSRIQVPTRSSMAQQAFFGANTSALNL